MPTTPTQDSIERIKKYVAKYREKTGTSAHPTPEVTDAVIGGLAIHLDELGRPLCPCNFYPDKHQELKDNGRR